MMAMKVFLGSALFLAVLGIGFLSANDVAGAAVAWEATPIERALEEMQKRSGKGPGENHEVRKAPALAQDNAYMGQLMLAVRHNWGFASAGRLNLACGVNVKVDMQGNVLQAVVSQSSGNAQYDESAVNAVIRTGQAGEFPPPPSEEYCDLELFFSLDGLGNPNALSEAERRALREQEQRREAAEKEEQQRRIADEREKEKSRAEEKERARAELDRTLQESGRLQPVGPKIFGFQLGTLYTSARKNAEEICKKREKILRNLNPCMDQSAFTSLLSGDDVEAYGTMSYDILVAGVSGILEVYSLPLSVFNYGQGMDKNIFIKKFEENYHLVLECKKEFEECKDRDNTSGYEVTINFKKDELTVKKIVKESDLIFK